MFVTDFCGFGMIYRKRTRMLSWGIDLDPIVRSCNGSRGICKFTNARHLMLACRNLLNNLYRTAEAEAYPYELVNMG
jgi:hypothetical protein